MGAHNTAGGSNADLSALAQASSPGAHAAAPALSEAFAGLQVARLNLSLRMGGSTPLRGLAASSLRGMLGRALAEAGGRGPGTLYDQVFESPPRAPGKRDTPPPPYVIDASPVPYEGLESGQTLEFGLTLIGWAIPRALDVIWAIDRYGRTVGLTEARVPFCVAQACAVLPDEDIPLFGDAQQRLPGQWSARWSWSADQLIEHLRPTLRACPTRIVVEFDTPLDVRERTRDGVQARRDVQFIHLFHKLFWAPELYASTYCGGSLCLDYEPLAALAQQVVKVHDGLQSWQEHRRSSRRALAGSRTSDDPRRVGRVVPVVGKVGPLVFEGVLEPFVPHLVLGRVFGVGKGRPWGLGRMRFYEDGAS